MNFRTRGSLFRALLIGFSVTLDSLCEIKNQRGRPVELYVHFSTIYSLFSAEISHRLRFLSQEIAAKNERWVGDSHRVFWTIPAGIPKCPLVFFELELLLRLAWSQHSQLPMWAHVVEKDHIIRNIPLSIINRVIISCFQYARNAGSISSCSACPIPALVA